MRCASATSSRWRASRTAPISGLSVGTHLSIPDTARPRPAVRLRRPVGTLSSSAPAFRPHARVGSHDSEGRTVMESAWWVVMWPGGQPRAVLSGNLLGDWLRDRLDPTLQAAMSMSGRSAVRRSRSAGIALTDRGSRAVDGVRFHVRRGGRLFVGESGSGKRITCVSVLRLLPKLPPASRRAPPVRRDPICCKVRPECGSAARASR